MVQISNKLSEPINLSFGVPQGSSLSPILFLVYVNDIGSSLLHGRLVQFADDTTFCFRNKSKTILEQQTFLDINNCVQKFNSLNLKANSLKSIFLNFALRSGDPDGQSAVLLDDTFLEEVDCSKFLGIFLDRELTMFAPNCLRAFMF
uniref:Reverse transcriptase domain-containing protein n=1 Tax=Cuerna arida TaxID=1464854 RepID=A0A1B6F657_9HEMI